MPSNLPPPGTESRCEPAQTSALSPLLPIRLPASSTSTASPASSIQPRASRCASSSSAE